MDWRGIKITAKTQRALRELKVHHRQSYNEVVKKLIKFYRIHNKAR